MAALRRQFKESPVPQGVDEEIMYIIDTEPWGGYTSGVTVTLKDPDGVDVSATCLVGSAIVSDEVITTPTVKNLVNGNRYRLEVKWIYLGNKMEAWGYIDAEV